MYAAVNDMTAKFATRELIELTDKIGAGVIDETRVNAALATAGNLIDSYLGAVYDLPLTSTPPILTDQACEIARYQLYGDAVPEAVKTRYDAAIAWLKDLARGMAKLDIAGTEALPAPATVMTADSDIACRRDRLKGF